MVFSLKTRRLCWKLAPEPAWAVLLLFLLLPPLEGTPQNCFVQTHATKKRSKGKGLLLRFGQLHTGCVQEQSWAWAQRQLTPKLPQGGLIHSALSSWEDNLSSHIRHPPALCIPAPTSPPHMLQPLQDATLGRCASSVGHHARC